MSAKYYLNWFSFHISHCYHESHEVNS